MDTRCGTKELIEKQSNTRMYEVFLTNGVTKCIQSTFIEQILRHEPSAIQPLHVNEPMHSVLSEDEFEDDRVVKMVIIVGLQMKTMTLKIKQLNGKLGSKVDLL